MALHPDLIALLEAFATADVQYLLIGGHALGIQGAPRFTKDVDFWIKGDPENLLRVDTALRRFGAPESTLTAIRDLKELDVAWMGVAPLRFDFMTCVPGGDFDDAYSRRVITQWAGAPVSVISANDLIALKRASGRPQDLVDADALGRLKT